MYLQMITSCNLSIFQLDAPLFVTWFQCIVAIVLCALFAILSSLLPQYVVFPQFKIDPKVCREVSEVSLYY